MSVCVYVKSNLVGSLFAHMCVCACAFARERTRCAQLRLHELAMSMEDVFIQTMCLSAYGKKPYERTNDGKQTFPTVMTAESSYLRMYVFTHTYAYAHMYTDACVQYSCVCAQRCAAALAIKVIFSARSPKVYICACKNPSPTP